MPTVDDLSVYRRDKETLEVCSHLTRGRCATVYMFDFADGRKSISPFLIPSYMQGITSSLISDAVDAFIEAEHANQSS